MIEDEHILDKYGEDVLIEAEIFRTWCQFLLLVERYENNSAIDKLAQSVIFKFRQAHYHLRQSKKYYKLAILNSSRGLYDGKLYYDFITNCNNDSMIYALNSAADMIAKLIEKCYPGVKFKKNPNKKNLQENEANFKKIAEADSETCNRLILFIESKEREYVRNYCNGIKHDEAFFSAGAFVDFDIDNDTIKKGYSLKKKYTRSNENEEFLEYVPRIFSENLKLMGEIGKSILEYHKIIVDPIDENLLGYVDNMSFNHLEE